MLSIYAIKSGIKTIKKNSINHCNVNPSLSLIAISNFCLNISKDWYSHKQISLKHVCEIGNLWLNPSSSSINLVTLKCNIANPVAGIRSEPVTNLIKLRCLARLSPWKYSQNQITMISSFEQLLNFETLFNNSISNFVCSPIFSSPVANFWISVGVNSDRELVPMTCLNPIENWVNCSSTISSNKNRLYLLM